MIKMPRHPKSRAEYRAEWLCRVRACPKVEAAIQEDLECKGEWIKALHPQKIPKWAKGGTRFRGFLRDVRKDLREAMGKKPESQDTDVPTEEEPDPINQKDS